ncbi:hypothetical protein LM597_00005 [Candidatus Acetothermia bacterium]|nr:hypothetical protein [Candidatus Acetothermia bacterium]
MKRILIITMLVLGLSVTGLAAGTLSGSWATDITVTTPQTPVFGVSSVLTVNYLIGGWTLGSVSRFSVDAWYQQDFRADGAIGAFTFTNLLRFDPEEVEFDFLRSTAKVDIAGVTFDSRFMIVGAELVPPPVVVPLVATSGFRLGFSAPVPPLTFAAGAYFGAYRFDTTWGYPEGPIRTDPHEPVFRGLDVDITMPFFTTTLTIDVDFTSDLGAGGFQDITFTVPRFPLGIPQLALDLTVKYTLTTKTVTVTPHITVVGWIHFQPFISIVPPIVPPPPPPVPAIEGLILEGLRLVWPIKPGVVTFTYEWDSRPAVAPHVAGPTVDGFARRQRIEIVYAVAPIRLDIEGRWVIPMPVPVVLPAMPAFPQQVQIDLEVDILENLALRTGVEFRAPVLHSISFGFTVTW